MSIVPAPSMLPDCIAHIQWGLTPIHNVAREIFRFSPFDAISPTVLTDRRWIMHIPAVVVLFVHMH